MTGPASLLGFRLSPHQEYLWLLGEGEGSPYLVQTVLLVEGAVSSEALSTAFDAVVRRHEILRTTFQCLPGMSLPVQVIGDDAGMQAVELDLRGLDQDVRSARLRDILATDARAPFDLAQGPLLRLHRLHLAQTSWLLVLTLPSLCADAASMRSLVGEIGREYGAALGLAGAVPEAMQYADFSEWIHQLNASDGEREGREHWRRQGIPGVPAASLPFERIAPLASPFCLEAVPVAVKSDVVPALRRLAGDAAGWSRLLLAGWQTLLWRLTGEEEVFVRVAFDGRRYEELRNAVGGFARHLPVVARPDAGDRFDELLRRTGERLAESARWQEYFDWNALSANDTPGWQIVPVGFELFETAAETRAAGAAFRLEHLRACSDRFKLKLSCALAAAEPSLRIEYDASLFEPSDVETLSRSLAALLGAVAQRPDSPVAELDILGPEERRRLIVELNQSRIDFPGDLCVHELFERQVERTPERLAAQEGERALGYAELNARANQLAWLLRRQGVGPEVRVAVSSVRTLETLVGMLAVLKAGGAYLPVERQHPRERLAQVLEDARPHLLLRTEGAVEEQGEIPALRVSLDDWIAADESTHNPERSAVPESLAYVLFTSGTTGRPKGVMVPHCGLVNYLSWCLRSYGVEEGWGSPVHSPVAFDLTVTSLFSPLLAGRAVWLLPDAPGAESLGAALRERGGFGLVKLTPAHLEMLAPDLEACGPAGRAR
ncbi:MAG TPA: AMP-binding protein, partial [Thermoanaerobaculia bacterium]|nr:AMP-binding protein [Thermoanaerobaculia bacterium]